MTSLLPNAEVEVPIACHPPVGEPPAQGNTPRAASPERRTGTAVHGPSDPLAVAATMSGAAAELQAAIQGREALCATPWSLTIVEHRHDAEFLREHLDIETVGLDEASWKSKLPPSGDVLLIGRTQRVAGDLLRLGVRQCFAGHVPLPYSYVSEFLEERAKASNYTVGKADLRELWKVVTDTAQAVDAAPTGHPDLQPQPAVLEALSLADLANMQARRFIVDGLCYDDSLVVLAGPPKSFKTVLGDDLCVAVADGGTWLDRKVTLPGLVIDCALEGMFGKKPRYQAHLGVHRFQDCNDPIHQRLFLMRTMPDITSTSGQDILLRTIDGLCTRAGQPLRLLKVDTLARGMSLAGLDENSTAEMGSFIAGLDRIRAKFPSMQLVIHHTDKTGNAERGSTALRGACDLMMFCKKQDNTETKVWVRDARDVEVPAPWIVSFAPVRVGLHDNGRPITGMRVDAVRVTADGNVALAPTKLGSDQSVERALLSAGVEGCTRAQVVKVTTLEDSTAWDALTRLVNTDRAVRNKGKTCRYWHKSFDPGSGKDPGRIRDRPPDPASSTIPSEDPVDPTAPLKGAGPDPQPDRAGPDARAKHRTTRCGPAPAHADEPVPVDAPVARGGAT